MASSIHRHAITWVSSRWHWRPVCKIKTPLLPRFYSGYFFSNSSCRFASAQPFPNSCHTRFLDWILPHFWVTWEKGSSLSSSLVAGAWTFKMRVYNTCIKISRKIYTLKSRHILLRMCVGCVEWCARVGRRTKVECLWHGCMKRRE